MSSAPTDVLTPDKRSRRRPETRECKSGAQGKLTTRLRCQVRAVSRLGPHPDPMSGYFWAASCTTRRTTRIFSEWPVMGRACLMPRMSASPYRPVTAENPTELCREKSSKCVPKSCPEMSRSRSGFGPNAAQIGRAGPNFGRSSPNLANVWPTSTRIGSCWPDLAKYAQTHQHRSMLAEGVLAESWQTSANIWPTTASLVEFCHSLAKSCISDQILTCLWAERGSNLLSPSNFLALWRTLFGRNFWTAGIIKHVVQSSFQTLGGAHVGEH